MRIRDFQLERFFAEYEFKAPYLMCSSDCESFTVQQILALEDGNADLGEVWLGYTETLGHPKLREEIAQLYQQIIPSEVIVTAGAEEAIFIFMNIALKPGDHVIYMSPAYQSLFEIANSIGCELTPWRLCEEEGWEVSLEELQEAIQPNTRAIILNNPHNPTGYLMGREMLKNVINIAREHNLYIFSDEVYRYLEYKEAYRLPAVCDLYEKGISLGVMSKAFGLAGLRIGWICTRDQEIFSKFASFKDYTSICNSAPSEFLAIVALLNKEYLLERNLEIIGMNLQLLDAFFAENNDIFSWHRPRAGSIAFPRLLIDQPIEDFCIQLVEKQGVLLLPGNYYGAGDKNFRIGFGRRNMPDALKLLNQYVQQQYR